MLKTYAKATRENYKYYFEKDILNSFLGHKKVKDIKKYDIQLFYKEKSNAGYSDGTVQILHKIVHPALQLAVDNEGVVKNVSDGCCGEYTKSRERKAMTEEEYDIFINEILPMERNGSRYRLIFEVMTGLMVRVGELIGLTWNDVDMREKTVVIDHEISYRKIDGRRKFYATGGKTKSAVRVIPMTNNVYQCFKKLWLGRMEHRSNTIIDGYSDFVFVSREGKPLYPATLNKALYRMVDKYNEAHPERKDAFPKISNHIFRHTGCTKFCESGAVDLNVMVKLMGHCDAKQILKTYDSVSRERIKSQVEKASERMAIYG